MFPNTRACSKWLHPVFIHRLHIAHYFLIVDSVINICNLGWNWLNGVRTSGTGFPQAGWVTGIYWQSSFWQLFSVSVLSQEVLVIGLGGHPTSLFRYCCMKLPPTLSHPLPVPCRHARRVNSLRLITRCMHKLDSPSHTNKRTHAEGEGNTEVGRVGCLALRLAVISKADMIGFQV